MNLSSIGLFGRGFSTNVAPAFNLPLNETNCTNCGLCVSLCPTGALTERSSLKKQVPLDERYEEKAVEINGEKASVLIAKYNGKTIRVIPNDDISRNANLSREEFFKLV